MENYFDLKEFSTFFNTFLSIKNTLHFNKFSNIFLTLDDYVSYLALLTHLGQYYPQILKKKCIFTFREHITKLEENGSAYKCFCTERRLNVLRRDAVRSHQIPKYDNRCRHLSSQDVKEKINAGIPYCIRFKVSLVHGKHKSGVN